jgi:hypothetical protein
LPGDGGSLRVGFGGKLFLEKNMTKKKSAKADHVVAPSEDAAPAVIKEPPKKEKFDQATRKIFVAHLAQSANVTAAAKAANVSTWTVYGERQKKPDFRDQWHQALCEGYLRLETELLGEALVKPSANTSATTLKSREQKYRLGTTLLKAHAASVKADSSAVVPSAYEKAGARDRILIKLKVMHDRLNKTYMENNT